MYGYSSLLRGALALGIFSGTFAASLQSLHDLPDEFLNNQTQVSFASRNLAVGDREFIIWRTADVENCAFSESEATERLAYRLASRCQTAGGTVIASYKSRGEQSLAICRGVVECKLPMLRD